ncbi:MAG: sulfotransferase [Pseudomonadota bacterium]
MTQSLAPRAAFNKAVSLINSGDVQQALAVCDQSIDRDAGDVTMVAMKGAILLKMGDLRQAEACLRLAIDLAPNFAKPKEDLGYLLLHAGRAGEAVELLEDATRLDPGSEQAWLNLGQSLAKLGKGDEADAAFEKAFALNPERKNLALASEHHRAGRLDEAENLYRQVLRGNPNNVDALRLLGGIAARNGRPDEAETLLRRALERAPDFPRALVDLAELLYEQHRLLETVDCLERAAEQEPNRPRIFYMLAAALAPLGRTEAALAAYRRTLEIRPDHAGALLGVGHTLKTVGRQQEAIDAYRECIRLRPDNGESYWSLANLKTYKLTDADIAAMQTVLSKEGEITEQSEVNFLFALGKASEDRQDYANAWDYYERGNRKQRMLEHYDPVQTEVTNDEIIEVFDADFLSAHSSLGSEDPAPIFVVGLPRSGSTLIEQILASHSMVEGTAELPYMGRVATSLSRNRADGVNYPHAVRELGERQLKALGEDYLRRAKLHRATDKPRFVDKMPNNFPTIGLIHLILPNAKIVDARRYPLDSTFSCYRQLFAKGQSFVYDLNDIGEYFLQYERLMDHWHEVLPGRVLTVQYEDMVMDQEAEVRRLLEYCELPWEDGCLRFYETERPIRTASSEQVRQPVYTSSIHYWRNYEAQLGELIDVLEPALPRYAKYENINR